MEKCSDAQISQLLQNDPVDLCSLYALSRLPGGFVSNWARTRVWPKLLGVNRFVLEDYNDLVDFHRDDDQVKCDVDRSLWNLKNVVQWTETLRESKRQSLQSIIKAVLCRNRDLHYYQGYHDIISVFLLVLEDDNLTFALSEKTSLLFFSDCMSSSFDTLSKAMSLILVIIQLCDSELFEFLDVAKMEPFFATSWVLTWFAHDVKEVEVVARLFDALLCSHPAYCLYLCAALVIYFREKVLQLDCDFPVLHNFLVRIPEKFGVPADELILIADDLMAACPPQLLLEKSSEDVRRLVNQSSVHWFRPVSISRWQQSDETLAKPRSFQSHTQQYIKSGKNERVYTSDFVTLHSNLVKVRQQMRNNVLKNRGLHWPTAANRGANGSNTLSSCLYQCEIELADRPPSKFDTAWWHKWSYQQTLSRVWLTVCTLVVLGGILNFGNALWRKNSLDAVLALKKSVWKEL